MGKITLSKNKAQKRIQLESLVARNLNFKTDQEIYDACNEELNAPLTGRTWRRYKQKYEWDFTQPTLTSKIQEKVTEIDNINLKTIKDELKDIEKETFDEKKFKKPPLKKTKHKAIELAVYEDRTVDLPKPVVKKRKESQYTKSQRNLIVNKICDLFATGMYYIKDLCGSQNISYETFNRWVNSDEIFYDKYKEAHQRSFMMFQDLFIDQWKQNALRKIFAEYEVSETIHYEYAPVLDEMSGMLYYDKRPVKSSITKTPSKPDVEMVKMFISTLNEFRVKSKEEQQTRLPETEGINDPVELLRIGLQELKDAGALESADELKLTEMMNEAIDSGPSGEG